MPVNRKAVIAAVAALTLGGSMAGSTALADAHTYTKEGKVSAKEANKLFKQAFKQKCLTVYEVRHIAHGRGQEQLESEGDDVESLYYHGTRRSDIYSVRVGFGDGCATSVEGYKR